MDLHSPLILDDMRFIESQLEQVKSGGGIPGNQYRWPGGVVYYILDVSVVAYTPLILQAMEEFRRKTCIRFLLRTNQMNYIKIFAGQGCYSHVGMIGGQQLLSLGNGCMYKGTIVHELGHAIGFFHEQNRSDRDQYLRIYWQNILEGFLSQFTLLQPQQNVLYTGFDYDSIMLYGNYAFSKDGRSMTMDTRNGQRLVEPYEKLGLTAMDGIAANRMYQC